MSRARSYRIECDGPPGGDWCDAGEPSEAIEMCETRQEAEAQARLEGWVVGPPDRCPYCRRPARR